MEWLTFPRFKSPSIFGRLLGSDAGHWSLYELAGLDRDRWLVTAVAIEVLSGELGAVIYAIDRFTDSGAEVRYDVDAVIAEKEGRLLIEHGTLPGPDPE